MFKLFILSLFLLTANGNTFAQNNIFVVNPGEKPSKAIPDTAQFYSAKFIRGVVQLRDGRSGGMILNYNSLFEEMMFVDEKGDTVSVINPQDFNYFVLDKDTFCFDNVYLHKIGSFGNLQLAERNYFTLSDVKKKGILGASATSVGIEEIRQTSGVIGIKNLVAQEVIYLKKNKQYYISNDGNSFKVATKNNIQKLAHEKQSLIKSYLKENTIDFNQREDLIRLLSAIE